jgi:hypothetical protein
MGMAERSALHWRGSLIFCTPLRSNAVNGNSSVTGDGIHWPQLDEDLSVAGLLRSIPAPESDI